MIDIPYTFAMVEFQRGAAPGVNFVQWLELHSGRYIPTEVGKHATIRFDQDEDATAFKLKFRL